MNRVMRILSVVLLLVSGTGCSRDETRFGTDAADDAKSNTRALAVERETSGATLGRVGYLVVSDSLLWVSDLAGDPWLHVFSQRTGQLLRSLGVKGSGPGDFRDVGALLPTNDSTSDVIVFDRATLRLTRVRLQPIDSVGNVAGSAAVAIWSMPTSPRVRTLGKIQAGYVGWASAESAAVLVRFDSGGAQMGSTPTALLGGNSQRLLDRLSGSASHHYCTSRLASEFAVAFRHVGRIEIRDSNAHLVRLADVPYPQAVSGPLALSPNVPRPPRWPQYSSCVATGDRVLAVHSGLASAVSANDSLRPDQPGELHVFDWTGHLLARLALPVGVERIALSADKEWLIGGGSDEPVLRWMRLPRGILP
ncbi:MAG: hypothetical protein MUD17_12485 [Gemmatimonadaceae bacterium]|jgi:hypothetical protein|nr:hypothetical protein [Gemmatimonadaceae bacterium]